MEYDNYFSGFVDIKFFNSIMGQGFVSLIYLISNNLRVCLSTKKKIGQFLIKVSVQQIIES